MDFAYGESVDVLTAGSSVDPYSNEPVTDWATATEVTIHGVAVEPRPSQAQNAGEPIQDARNAVVSGFTLYFPPGSTLTPYDRVRVRGEVYDVMGDPADWRNPFTGWHPGLVVQVGRTEG